jgi:hypothetical protein
MTIELWIPMKKVPTVTHQQKKVAIKKGKPIFKESHSTSGCKKTK